MVKAVPTKMVNLRVPADEAAIWQEKADAASLPLSEWIRTRIRGTGALTRFNVAQSLTPGAPTPKRKDK